jgi:hypothetical protein
MNEVEVRRSTPRLALTVLAAIHLTVVLWHGGAHAELAVGLSRFQTLFVFGVIVIAPPVATLFLWTRLEQFALLLYVWVMSAALLFGVYYHLIAVSPDNINYLPPGNDIARQRFTISALSVAVVELIATLYSVFALLFRRPAIQT